MSELIHDEGTHNRYFHVLPNMYDDDLDPYEYRLIGHYKRVGISWEGTRKIAAITKMSVGKVAKTRKALEDKKLIRVEYLTRKDLKDRGLVDDAKPNEKTKIVVVSVLDVMAQNITRYQKIGVHVVNTPVHTVNSSVHVVNERRTKEKELMKKAAHHTKKDWSAEDGLISAWVDETNRFGSFNTGYRRKEAKQLLDMNCTVQMLLDVLQWKRPGKKDDYEFRYFLDDVPEWMVKKAREAKDVITSNAAQERVEAERRANRILWGLESAEALEDAS